MVQSYMVNLSQYKCPVGITITGRISNSSPLSAVCVVFWSIERWKVEKQLLVPTSVCQRVSCEAPSAVLHAVMRVYGQRVIYTCVSEYKMSDGSTTFEREPRRFWTPRASSQVQKHRRLPETICGPHGTCVDGVNGNLMVM